MIPKQISETGDKSLSDQDFGAEIDRIVTDHRAMRAEAWCLMPGVALTVIWFSGIAFATYWASR